MTHVWTYTRGPEVGNKRQIDAVRHNPLVSAGTLEQRAKNVFFRFEKLMRYAQRTQETADVQILARAERFPNLDVIYEHPQIHACDWSGPGRI